MQNAWQENAFPARYHALDHIGIKLHQSCHWHNFVYVGCLLLLHAPDGTKILTLIKLNASTSNMQSSADMRVKLLPEWWLLCCTGSHIISVSCHVWVGTSNFKTVEGCDIMSTYQQSNTSPAYVTQQDLSSQRKAGRVLVLTRCISKDADLSGFGAHGILLFFILTAAGI